MSQALAIAEARELQSIVRRHGVKCTIELMPGRPWSGSVWYSQKRVLMNHHTAGPSSGLTPSYALCRKGRSDVPGPLCNGYGGRDHVFRIVTMGLANHPGAGGPLTVAGVTMPRNSARIASFGIEWEHNGTSPWPAEMREFMGRVGAAVLEWMARPLGASIEHKTWAPDRKIDRNTFTAASGQALIKQYQGGSSPNLPDTGPDEELFTVGQYEAIMAKLNYIESQNKANAGDIAYVQKQVKSTAGLVNANPNAVASFKAAADTYSWYTQTKKIAEAVQALADAGGVQVDLSGLEELDELLASVARLEAQLRVTTDLLKDVADGQVTPESVAEELAERLAA